jgi:uncharacterized protein (TIGR02266 family)
LPLKGRAWPADSQGVSIFIEGAGDAKASERRVEERVELEVEVGLHTDHNFYTGLTQDISEGGIFVATHQIKPLGHQFTVKFKVPGWPTPISSLAEVRWIREGSASARSDAPVGMGLRFLELPPQGKMAIGTFMKKRDSIFWDL